MVANLQETFRRENQDIRGEITGVVTRVAEISATTEAHNARLTTLERALSLETSQNRALQLHIQDLEDRGRRNNLRLRGVPEAEGQEDLLAETMKIFQ